MLILRHKNVEGSCLAVKNVFYLFERFGKAELAILIFYTPRIALEYTNTTKIVRNKDSNLIKILQSQISKHNDILLCILFMYLYLL